MKKPTAPSLPRGNPTGFTLAEVIVVVVILGIAATVIIPMISDTSGMRVTSAARHISSTILFAQTSAISNQQHLQIVFDSDAETYEVQDADGVVIPDPIIPGKNLRTDYLNDPRLQNIRIETANFDGGAKIWFDRLGMPYSGPNKDNLNALNAGSVIVQSGDNTMTITVEPITGRILIN
ncbi:MAG: prepilin-type N-terminal cleavage/methylation domain-containing protein [Planctomycetes bacterium]|nr:prepilin-type N-terminal cleavage/methylation domain-containing protein [Planctomycetota bacterium]